MTVGLKVGGIVDEVGAPDFLHAFFSTISRHLEPQGWGSRFPELMEELYQGRLDAAKATKAITDLRQIQKELKAFGPNQVIWDFENPARKPPWEDNISRDITDLSNYFVTSTGKDLFEVLFECLSVLQRRGGSLTIEHY